MTMDFSNILSAKRDRVSSETDRNISVEAESDRGRLVFAAPFRRLQQKAQVFSLEANAAVRSRLTHSIEVSQVGRLIADKIVDKLSDDDQINVKQARAFVTFVEVACLMHDIGNPPFGHFGEAAISHWFKHSGPNSIKTAGEACGFTFNEGEINEILADFIEFDGNCQGLRIAAILQWHKDEHGLNLTYTSLLSYLKYLRRSKFQKPTNNPPFQKKAGYFSTEEKLVHRMWMHFEIDPNSPKRFPLAFIMEAADDIAYCISDLEDSIEKKLLNHDIVFTALHKQWQEKNANSSCILSKEIEDLLAESIDTEKPEEATARFTDFRTKMTRKLAEIASSNFLSHLREISAGTFTATLIQEASPGGAFLEELKNYCRKNVYQDPSIERKELAGLEAVRGLLDHFNQLLVCRTESFQAALQNKKEDQDGTQLLVERKLLNLFPKRYKKAYWHATRDLHTLDKREAFMREWNYRAHLITDFISGMTDDFALWSFQMLSGIRSA